MISKIQYLLVFLFVFTIFLYSKNYYSIYSHIPNNNNNISLQEITDQNDNIKVQFGYDPENIKINTLTELNFSVLNSTTNEHIKNFLARVVVTEGSEVFGFNNIKVNDGDFSVKHSFTNYGSHQVLLRADTNYSITSAPFEVMLPSQSSPFLVDSDKSFLDNYKVTQNFTTYIIIVLGVVVSIVITIILLSILKKK